MQRPLQLGLPQLNTGYANTMSSRPATFMDAFQNHWQKGDKAALFATLLLGKNSDSQALGMLSGKKTLGKWWPALLCYFLCVLMILTQSGKEETP